MSRHLFLRWILVLFALVTLFPTSARAVDYPGPAPGTATASLVADRIDVANDILKISWGVPEQGLRGTTAEDRQTNHTWQLKGDLFQVVLKDGTTYASSSMKRIGDVRVEPIEAQPQAIRLADQSRGIQVQVELESADGRLRATWQARLHDGANYVRQHLTLHATDKPLPIERVIWIEARVGGAENQGYLDGSVVTVGWFFLGCEDPMAGNRVVAPPMEEVMAGRITRSELICNTELTSDTPMSLSFVIGVTPARQLRRGFLYYVEHERAHPYRPFLHYNSWYDIAWQPFALNETNCLEAIDLFGERFIKRHNVVMDSLVFDDGWDNPETLWQFHSGFPQGFTPLTEACTRHGTRLGVWLSPFGGYGEPREKRLALGRKQGFEINEAGLSLGGPKYYEAFRQACVNMIRQYQVNYFKFDGIAEGMRAGGAGAYWRDVQNMQRLMRELRQEDPQLYINLTTGSWPSPYWLRYADSLWRQGGDMGLAGVGTNQQQWLTYRDQQTYENIVSRSPLYPLNALMTQGVAYSRQGMAGDATFTADGFRDDVHAFFGSGTSLQELYIQPDKLTDVDWQVLAEAAKWARANADVLVDTHWIGGDPAESEVYGYASWSPRKGTIMLRNPDEQPRTFALDVGGAFELPDGAPRDYVLTSPWAADAEQAAIQVTAGRPFNVNLKPFEVVVYDAMPDEHPPTAASQEGFEPLFPQDGIPEGWVVRQWSDLNAPADAGVVWKVVNGVLHGSEPRGTWLVSEKEYGDFILQFEFKLGPRGNSGCAMRAPLAGDPAFDGLELQMADFRYNPEAKDSELTGGIYRAIAPTRQVFKPTEWNTYVIELVGTKLKVQLNGELIQDVDLSQFDQTVKRHDDTDAPPIKDRPRRGHLGFQELSRDGDHVQIRNARIKVLDSTK